MVCSKTFCKLRPVISIARRLHCIYHQDKPMHFRDNSMMFTSSSLDATLCRPFTTTNPNEDKTSGLLERLQKGDRGGLAEAITLVESRHPEKRAFGQEVLARCLKLAKTKAEKLGQRSCSLRIGLSGPPGAGKSTFIEALGNSLTAKSHRVAVLAIDPSSTTTGGSLLADKTRMTTLSRDPNAYIRPSPTSGKLGGVSRGTNDAIILCEAAGFDIVIVETVGVGQSEHSVVDMVDMFVLILPPAAGDELQGIKRGVVELSDLILINKADGDLLPAAKRIQTEYTSALKFVRPRSKHWQPKVMRCSSLLKEGLTDVWDTIQQYHEQMLTSGIFEERRREQLRVWMWNYISDSILDKFKTHPRTCNMIPDYEQRVIYGELTPGIAADALISEFFKGTS